VLVWFVMEGERKENDAEGKEMKWAFLSEASNDCYFRFFCTLHAKGTHLL